MKKTKLLAMTTVLLAMGLAACNGTSSSAAPSSAKPSSETPSSSVAPSTSQAPSSSSTAVAKEVTVAEVNLANKSNKAYLQIKGTAAGYTAAEFKWALALMTTDNNGTASEDFILGTSSEFAAADYTLPGTLNADGSYVFEYNLSDIAKMKPGLFTIFASVSGIEGNFDLTSAESTEATDPVTNDGVRVKDGVNRYYIRADVGNKNTLAVDALPPIEIAEASIVTVEGVAYAKIGGDASSAITQAVLDGYDSFVQFQNTANWSNTRRRKAGTYVERDQSGNETTIVVENDEYYWKLEGTKAYLYADVSFFADGGNYNTHLNVTTNEQADCKMDAAIDANFTMTNASGVALNVNVVAIPGGTEAADFWGNLGFRVTAA